MIFQMLMNVRRIQPSVKTESSVTIRLDRSLVEVNSCSLLISINFYLLVLELTVLKPAMVNGKTTSKHFCREEKCDVAKIQICEIMGLVLLAYSRQESAC